MDTRFKIRGIVTLVVGLQLIAPAVAGATTPLGTFSHSRFHSAANSQALPDISLSNKHNGDYTPPDTDGPGSSLGAGTR